LTFTFESGTVVKYSLNERQDVPRSEIKISLTPDGRAADIPIKDSDQVSDVAYIAILAAFSWRFGPVDEA